MKVRHLEVRNFRGIKSMSWHIEGELNCLIGAGDTCKTTILTALDYALSPRSNIAFEDADFFDQDTDEQIVIQVTLAEWDESRPLIKSFFRESKFAQFKCGLSANGPEPEPLSDTDVAISISLRVDKSLEPKWSVVKGRDETEDQDRKSIYATDRAALGLSRLDLFSDYHFTWGHNTILTRLSQDAQGNINTVLSELAREMRKADIASHPAVGECQIVADTVKSEALDSGVSLTSLSPKIDIQRQSVRSGALSLHEDNVPLRNKGTGTKRLIGAAMQMKLHGGKNVSLIDEIEMGLEPHRIRGLIHKLRNSSQQVFATTHSPVVIRELNVSAHEIYVCKRDAAGTVRIQSLGQIPDIQGPLRANAEAFLGKKIVACEGATEIGCLRAYDVYRFDSNDPPVWSLATSYLNCGGASKVKTICPTLIGFGYGTGALCDNDAPDQLSHEDLESLKLVGVHVCQWDEDNSTEQQLFAELPWANVPELLSRISDNHDSIQLATIVDLIRSEPQLSEHDLTGETNNWSETPALRQVIGRLAKTHGWIKRIDYAEKTFEYALPILPDEAIIKARLNSLWTWIQDE